MQRKRRLLDALCGSPQQFVVPALSGGMRTHIELHMKTLWHMQSRISDVLAMHVNGGASSSPRQRYDTTVGSAKPKGCDM